MNIPDDHPDELLTWYVNGTLAGAERIQVEEHLRSCARCREEAVFLGALRRGVQSPEQVSPGDLGLKRLLRDARARRTASHNWWRPALAAAAVVIAAQGALLAAFWASEPAIVPLAGKRTDGVHAQIQFQPTATEAQIRALLQEAGATVVDGPGALGIYRIRLEKPDLALARLRARPDVLKHVAPE